jgi:hypothetical protein
MARSLDLRPSIALIGFHFSSGRCPGLWNATLSGSCISCQGRAFHVFFLSAYICVYLWIHLFLCSLRYLVFKKCLNTESAKETEKKETLPQI